MQRQFLRQQLLQFGKYFTESDDQVDEEVNDIDCLLPNDRVGFNHIALVATPYVCRNQYDPRAVCSLPLISAQSRILAEYENKLPILTVNTTRLQYTMKAFKHVRGSTSDYINEALQFLVKHDLRWIEKAPDSKQVPANLKFSRFLHLLRTTGYEDYVFSLATKLKLNVDYVRRKRSVTEQDDHEFVHRYYYVGCQTPELYYKPVIPKVPVFQENLLDFDTNNYGYITGIREGDRWYVDITSDAIIVQKPISSRYSNCYSNHVNAKPLRYF